MNKKGFTLIELLAVIVILGVVMLIGTVSIAGVRDQMNKNMFETKLELAIGAAKSWGQDNKELLPRQISVGELIGNDFLKTEEKISQTEYTSCEDYNKTGSDCWVLTNNMDNSVVNKLNFKVYIENNRVYACIVKDEANRLILKEESDWSIFEGLKYYCQEG